MNTFKLLGTMISVCISVFAGTLLCINSWLYANVIPYSLLLSFLGIQLSDMIYFIRKEVKKRYFYGYLFSSVLFLLLVVIVVPPYTYEQAVQLAVEHAEGEVEIIPLAKSDRRTPIINRSAWFIRTAYYIHLQSIDTENLHYIVFPQSGEVELLEGAFWLNRL